MAKNTICLWYDGGAEDADNVEASAERLAAATRFSTASAWLGGRMKRMMG